MVIAKKTKNSRKQDRACQAYAQKVLKEQIKISPRPQQIKPGQSDHQPAVQWASTNSAALKISKFAVLAWFSLKNKKQGYSLDNLIDHA